MMILMMVGYALFVVDYLLTRRAVALGLAQEGNPILVAVMNNDLMTLAVILVAGVLLWWTYRQRAEVRPEILWVGYGTLVVTRLAVLGIHVQGLLGA